MEQNQNFMEASVTLGPCYDPTNQEQEMQAHNITQAEFDTYVNAYFNVVPAPPVLIIAAEDIYNCLFDPRVDCSSSVIIYGSTPSDTTNNDDIVFGVITSIIKANPELGNGTTTSFYPITLFLGFFTQPSLAPLTSDPEFFGFSKAAKSDGKGGTTNCIVLQITTTDGMKTYWDLSSTIPPTLY